MTCPRCGLAGLPARARFCARCGLPLTPLGSGAAARALAPVWLLALLWLGAGLLFAVAVLYTALALGAVPREAIPPGTDLAALRAGAALVAAMAASLAMAHAAAALGLMAGRAWARPFTTMVCVVWGLTCVGLPVALLGINALWRGQPH
jgi:hypothetical protein